MTKAEILDVVQKTMDEFVGEIDTVVFGISSGKEVNCADWGHPTNSFGLVKTLECYIERKAFPVKMPDMSVYKDKILEVLSDKDIIKKIEETAEGVVSESEASGKENK